MPTIDQIEIRRGTSSGRVETIVYNIGASGGVAAVNVSYDDSSTHLGADNVQTAIQKIKTNFQAGVDAVYDAVVAKGSTPASHSLSDVIAGIGNIPTGITPTGTFVYTGSESSWTQDISTYQYADASNVYNKGYSDGATHVTGNPAIVLASGHPINTDSEDSLDIHIYNNTTNTLTAIITGSLNGATGTNVKTLNGEDIGFISDGISIAFPPNGDFHFKQNYNGGATNKEGNLYITVIGDYNTFDNQIIWNAGTDGTTGTARFY